MLESMCMLARFMAAVEDALIVAGGLGTRMYPVSAFLSKESLPLIDIPVLIHLAHEAKVAGVKRIHIISSPNKDLSPLLKDITELHSNRPELDAKLFSSFSDIEIKVPHLNFVSSGVVIQMAASHLSLCPHYHIWDHRSEESKTT